jgi:hypothetical protein
VSVKRLNYEQILSKAIEIAIGNGFAWRLSFGDHTRFDYSLEQIIYNHDFAKALWGEFRAKKKLTKKVRYEYRDKSDG